MHIFSAIAFWWMVQDPTDDKSTLTQAMSWCCQATNHHLIHVDLHLCHYNVSLGHNKLIELIDIAWPWNLLDIYLYYIELIQNGGCWWPQAYLVAGHL